MSLGDWRSNSKIAGAVVALLLGFTTAHWVPVAQLPVSKEMNRARQSALDCSFVSRLQPGKPLTSPSGGVGIFTKRNSSTFAPGPARCERNISP
jgi:hypothetical protein